MLFVLGKCGVVGEGKVYIVVDCIIVDILSCLPVSVFVVAAIGAGARESVV